MLLLLLLLLVAVAAGELHESPYLTGNKTTCPGRWVMYSFLPCAGQGTCDEATGECQCANSYRGPDCTYALRSRRTAFILSFLLGTWGAGRLYLGLIGMGILQLMGMALLLSLPCFPLCCMCVTSDRGKLRRLHRVVLATCVVGMTGILAWWIADWLVILVDAEDVYGFPLSNDLKWVASQSTRLTKFSV